MLRDRKTVYVDLQPGDATAYTFTVTPLAAMFHNMDLDSGLDGWKTPGRYMVTRFIGGQPYGSVIVYSGVWSDELTPLSPNNEWTVQIFAWWLECLFIEIARH